MGGLQLLAREIGADERTLRRAAASGGLRLRRPTPRTVDVPEAERTYLRDHWPLLRDLRAALRTEPNVRLAVLFGSAARGDDRTDSDLDLLVEMREPGTMVAGLARRLEDALARDVDLARLDRVEQREPLLLLQALDEGRVLVDRDHRWPALKAQRDTVARRAVRLHNERRRRAVAHLTAPG